MNGPPVASDASVSTPAGTAVGITLHATDPDGDSLTYAVASRPPTGHCGQRPEVTYTPARATAATTPFTFLVSDGRGGADAAPSRSP